MTPEMVTAAGAATGAIVSGALSAWQGRQVAHLKSRVESLEQELHARNSLFRSAVLYIRDLLRHAGEVESAHRDGRAVPALPAVPGPLAEEI